MRTALPSDFKPGAVLVDNDGDQFRITGYNVAHTYYIDTGGTVCDLDAHIYQIDDSN